MIDKEEMKVNPMWSDFPEIESELIRCKRFMMESIDIPNKKVREEVLNLINADAKFIRPALMILIGKISNGGNRLDDDFIKMAATMEFLHTATLVHDDIVDDSDMRRGIETLQSKMGKDVAVYAGDYMISSVFRNILEYGKTMENCRFITDCVNTILSGELIQMENRNNFDIDIDDYYKIIKGKTAVLLALCCYEGAFMSGHEEYKEISWKFGLSVGMAFQIIDDVLDFTNKTSESKKPVNHDFKEGNFTLPVIKSVEKYRDELSNIKNRGIYDEKINDRIRNIVNDSGGIEYAKKMAEKYSYDAETILESYKDSLFKNYLSELVFRLLNRSY